MPRAIAEFSRPAGVPLVHPVVISVSRNRDPGTLRYPSHHHAHYELIRCEAGIYRCRIAGTECRLQPGETLLVQPGERHEDPLGGAVDYLACGFRLDPGGEQSPVMLATPAPIPLPTVGPALDRLMALVAQGADAGAGVGDWPALDGACHSWLAELLTGLPSAALAPAFRRREDTALGERLRQVLAQHPERAIPLQAFAADMGLTPRAFAQACHDHLGMPPLAARRQARCQAAAALLFAGEPVAVVAERLGFANPFHFSRAFRKAFGVPPGSWRR